MRALESHRLQSKRNPSISVYTGPRGLQGFIATYNLEGSLLLCLIRPTRLLVRNIRDSFTAESRVILSNIRSYDIVSVDYILLLSIKKFDGPDFSDFTQSRAFKPLHLKRICPVFKTKRHFNKEPRVRIIGSTYTQNNKIARSQPKIIEQCCP